MERRDKKFDRLEFRVNHKTHEFYKRATTWEEFISTQGVRPTDYFIGFEWRTEKFIPMMSLDGEVKEDTSIFIYVEREREETDEEYFARKQEEAKHQQKRDEEEKLEYLRLKAKYESS